jgi:hypothetical protein
VPLKAEALDAFKTEIMAALARLISRPRGRALVAELRNERTSGPGETKILFMMSNLFKLVGMRDYGFAEPYVGAKAIDVDPIDAAPKADGGRITAGKGSTTAVEVAPGVRDASLMDYGDRGTIIPSPTFIGIGHELIHAAHYLRGSYVKTDKAEAARDYGGQVEEFLTIASAAEREPFSRAPYAPGAIGTIGDLEEINRGLPTEADLRSEHGLGIRTSHEGLANPFLHPGALDDPDPGHHVDDVLQWLEANWPIDDLGGQQERAELHRRRPPQPGPQAPTTATAAPQQRRFLGWLRSLVNR